MSLRARRPVLAVATTSAVLVAAGLVAAPAAATTATDPHWFAAQVTTRDVLQHLEALQEVADEHGGTRASGTPGYDASGDYVQGRLEDAGYTVERQPFDFVHTETLAETLVVGGTPVPVTVMDYSPSTPEGGVTAPLRALPPDDATPGCEPADFDAAVAGTIVLLGRGVCPFGDKQAHASAAGAVGVVVYNSEPGPLAGTLGAPVEGAPAGGVSQEDGAALLARLAAAPALPATLDLRQLRADRTTFNLVAQTPQGDPDDVIMLGAHLDSVAEGPGINDNGTGSAGVLQTALELADVAPTGNAVRFAWWGAEESGLLGSQHYVTGLPAEEQAKITGYLNFDMIGSPNHVLGVYDADQSTHVAPVAVPPGSEALEQVFTDYFDGTAQPWVDSEFSGRSDYQGFIVAGIPAGGLFTGADEVKTEEQVALFGGTAGIAQDPNYHRPGDDLANVDRQALTTTSRAIAFATMSLADDPTPLDLTDNG
ncbi:MAG: family metallo-hydrolase [Modestobacter sp.]|jgi:Zn-dependent M28 family amino/carboxypeptidase|nr:family metallo-hydrolase [Modestobacter sp.]